MMLDGFPVCWNVFKLFALLDTELNSQFTAAGTLAIFFAELMSLDLTRHVFGQATTAFVISLGLARLVGFLIIFIRIR